MKNPYKLVSCLLFIIHSVIIPAQTTNSISQYGITWTFSAQHQFGQYANGDYWVLGPVTITGITPDYINGYNGWEVNPSDIIKQGFDKRINNFDAAKIPALPYVAQPNQSIVKAISVDTTIASQQWYLQTAAVLTVVGAVPANNGSTVFRPPYFSANKKIYSINDVNTSLLPSVEPVAQMPSLATLHDNFKRVQLDHKYEWTGRMLHPEENIPNYGGSIAIRNAEGALRLMMNDPIADKWPALIAYLQMGIDLYHIAANGGSWKPNGGHAEGRKLPIAFAAWLLNDQGMKDTVRNAGVTKFGENGGIYYSNVVNRVLYGQQGISGDREYNYWQSAVEDRGARTRPDPYGYIDGGRRPWEVSYQQVLSMPWKAEAICLHMVGDLKSIWNHQHFLDYVDRWVGVGAWTQSDPCAPHDGSMANYGITFGPDGNGGCILDTDSSDGIGRFPSLHGAGKDNGNYSTTDIQHKDFVKDLWNKYRKYGEPIKLNPSANATICAGEFTTLFFSGIDTAECLISWNGGAFGTDTFYVASPASSGNISAAVKYKNGLGTMATHNFLVTVTICAGIDEATSMELKMVPNPTKGVLTFYGLNHFEQDVNVTLYNSMGAIVYAEKINGIKEKYTMDLRQYSLSEGVYFIVISDGNKSAGGRALFIK